MIKFIQKNLVYKNMKKYITFSLFVFTAIVAGVLIVNFISSQNNNQQNATTNTNQINGVVSGTKSSSTGTNLVLSMTELAKHNSYNSCWLLISGKIYDVTSYLNSHPGGEAEILKTCGTDATVIYDNRDNTGAHSSRARAMLADYFIGNLDQTIKIN
jgi:cytochrome b involved in lipid metabolism